MGALSDLRIAVAGGGAIGWTLAVSLARAGAAVTLFDAPGRGPNASTVAAGMLAPAFESLFDPGGGAPPELLRAARDLWPDLAASIGLPLSRGALGVGSPADVAAWQADLARCGFIAERLDAAATRSRSPGVREGLAGVYAPADLRLEAGAAIAALRAAARSLGVAVIARTVLDFDRSAVRLDDGSHEADRLVIATGAGRALLGLAPELAVLSPVKGHILRAPGLALAGPVLRFAGGYVCPGADGALIGASMEPGRDDVDIEPGMVARLKAAAAAIVPAVADARVEARAGVRAATPDGLPLVGPSSAPDVWIAAGARRNGWLMAPLIADVVAAGLGEEAEPPWARRFSPNRFG